MAKQRPTKQVRIDQDLYDFFTDYAERQEGYISTTQAINNLLRQAVRATGIAIVGEEKNKDL